MKKFKKLIPAFCMLLISAVLMGTSTYAWFSMNKTVTANGMEVTAKSNSEFLLIGAGNSTNANAIQTGKLTTVSAHYATTGNDDKKVFPAAYTTTEIAANAANGSAKIEADSWYTANSNKTGEVQAGTDAKNVKAVTEGDKDHMLTYTVKLTLSKDSNEISKKIKVTPTFTTADNSVKALVVFGNDVSVSAERILLDSTKTTGVETTNKITLNGNDTYLVTIYVFIDGNSTNIYSEYAGANTIKGSLSLQFDLVDNTPAA